MKVNYQKKMEEQIQGHVGDKLLLHVCCGPCSTYVLEYLSEFVSITVYYDNPNIYPPSEYDLRVEEAKKVVEQISGKYPIDIEYALYEPEVYYEVVRGKESLGENSERCAACYRLRLERSARYAKAHGYSLFTTSLSISPHKNSQVLNEIGQEVASEEGLEYLLSDFKKRGGYQRSVQLSKELGLYRQDYCGCVFSKREMEKRNELSRDR